MKFSILVPTRDRQQGLINLIDSMVNTIHEPSNVELFIAFDTDDHQTVDLLERRLDKSKIPFEINLCPRPRSEWLNKDYYNWMAFKSRGDFIWAVGDDVVFLTEHWDKILNEKLEEHKSSYEKDGILYVGVEDSTPPPPNLNNPPAFCCFPIVSRTAINVLGYFLPPTLPTWGADYILYLVYGENGINRTLDLSRFVAVDHVSHHNGKVERDALNLDVERRFKAHTKEINRLRDFKNKEDIAKLKEYIKNAQI